MASPFSRKRLRQLLHELNLRWMPPADIIWSKGVGDFCDVAGPWKYRRGRTDSTQSDAFFPRHYGAAAGLVWVRLGTIAREGQACDLDRFAKVALPHITRPFILITTFAVVNLVVGLIVNSMQDAHSEEETEKTGNYRDEVVARLERIERMLESRGK